MYKISNPLPCKLLSYKFSLKYSGKGLIISLTVA